MKRWIALSLCMAMLAGCAGCSAEPVTTEASVLPDTEASERVCAEEDAMMITEFAVKLLQNSKTDKNLLLSPISVLCAAGMLMNGADGETLSQLEAVIGADTETLNRCLSEWMRTLQEKEGLLAANSVWLNDAMLTAREPFLQTMNDLYSAELFARAFDEEALAAVNQWCSEHTDGMIPALLDELPADAVMYLINALCFKKAWDMPYKTSDVHDRFFTAADGSEQPVQMMKSTESVYLEDASAVGFMKYYEDGNYAFAALLPDEDCSLDDYIASLDGQRLAALLAGAVTESVSVQLPKFSVQYSTELSELFRTLGASDVFDPERADLSGIGDELYVSRILHKTSVTVNETGTEAAAATAAEIMLKSVRPMRGKAVILDRPFLYMIVDLKTNIPVFIGTVTSLEG